MAQKCQNLVRERYSIESLVSEAKAILEVLKHD